MMLEIGLTVGERLGVSRVNEGVRSGVPFPKGVLTSADSIRLAGPRGVVPVDGDVLSRWDDGSIRWLLLSFPATVDANHEAHYTLQCCDGSGPVGSLTVDESADAFMVDTGALRFAIDKAKFGLLRNAQVKGERGAWAAVSEAGLAFAARNYNYRDYFTTHDECLYSVVCEERGSAHAVFKVTGTLVNRAKTVALSSLDYVCRIFCSAGSPSAMIRFTIQNRQDTPQELLRSLSLVLDVPGATNAHIGWSGEAKALALAAEDAIAAVQTGPTNARPWADFGYTLIDDAAGRAIDRCEKSPGWAGIDGPAGGARAAIGRFWQKHPKGFRFEEGLLGVSLHPPEAGLFVLPQGMDYSDDVLITFHAPGEQTSAAAAGAAFQDPLFACASPEWYCVSGAFGWLSPSDETNFSRYERLVRGSFNGLVRGQEKERMYGALDFGDTSGDYSSQRDYWLNAEYDTPHCCLLQFGRTGGIDYLRWGEDSARHQMDIDTIHFCPVMPRATGTQYKHERAHTTYRSAGAGEFKDITDHVWAEGMCDLYCLTGNRRALEVACEVGDFMIRQAAAGIRGSQPRNYAWPLMALIGIYQATGEQRHLDGAAEVVRQVLAREHPTRGVWLTSWGVDENGVEIQGSKMFMVGLLMEAMSYYHALTGDPNVARWLVKTARTICDEGWVEKDKGFYYTPALADRDHGRTTDLRQLVGLVYAYTLSPDPNVLDIALRNFDAALDVLLEQEGEEVSGKQFTTFTRSTPRFVAIAGRIGAWKGDEPSSR